MAAPKKTVKPVAKLAETTVKTDTVAAPVAEVKKPVAAAAPKAEAVKKEAAPKAAAKKETAPKAAAKKAAPKKTAAKKTVKKAEQKSNLHVQFAGKSYSQEELVKMAQDVWKYDLKQKAKDLASIELYVKPEENVVYYVMNQEFTGSFGI